MKIIGTFTGFDFCCLIAVPDKLNDQQITHSWQSSYLSRTMQQNQNLRMLFNNMTVEYLENKSMLYLTSSSADEDIPNNIPEYTRKNQIKTLIVSTLVYGKKTLGWFVLECTFNASLISILVSLHCSCFLALMCATWFWWLGDLL